MRLYCERSTKPMSAIVSRHVKTAGFPSKLRGAPGVLGTQFKKNAHSKAAPRERLVSLHYMFVVVHSRQPSKTRGICWFSIASRRKAHRNAGAREMIGPFRIVKHTTNRRTSTWTCGCLDRNLQNLEEFAVFPVASMREKFIAAQAHAKSQDHFLSHKKNQDKQAHAYVTFCCEPKLSILNP